MSAGWVERRRTWLLAGALLVGLALRCVAIDGRFSSDDSYTWFVSSAPHLSGLIHRLIDYENTPPLYYLLVRPLPDGHEFWLRVPAVLASTAMIAVLYALVRPLLGTRVALLGALGLAVAPFALASADLARGFSLADLSLLVVVWAAARLAGGASGRWWWLYGAGSVAALWTEYNSALVLGVIALTLLALGTPRRRETIVFAALPLLTFLPWIPWLIDSQDKVGVTKVGGVAPDVSIEGARNIVLSLVYGRLTFNDYGTAATPRAIVAVALVAACCLVLRRHADRNGLAFWFTGALAVEIFAVHWLGAIGGVPGTFTNRYVTVIIPLLIVPLAVTVLAIPWRRAGAAATAALLVLAVAIGVIRSRNEPNPDMRPVRAAAAALHPRTLLTNTAIVMYYLRDLHPRLDRPFGYGRNGEPACARTCPRPLVIVDDTATTAGGARRGPGRAVTINRFVVRLHPAARG